jgi:hypothetical protein
LSGFLDIFISLPDSHRTFALNIGDRGDGQPFPFTFANGGNHLCASFVSALGDRLGQPLSITTDRLAHPSPLPNGKCGDMPMRSPNVRDNLGFVIRTIRISIFVSPRSLVAARHASWSSCGLILFAIGIVGRANPSKSFNHLEKFGLPIVGHMAEVN